MTMLTLVLKYLEYILHETSIWNSVNYAKRTFKLEQLVWYQMPQTDYLFFIFF